MNSNNLNRAIGTMKQKEPKYTKWQMKIVKSKDRNRKNKNYIIAKSKS